MSKANPFDAAKNALKQADYAARRGDLREAERWAENAEILRRAMEAVAKEPPSEEELDEEARAELLRRLARFVEADRQCQIWDQEAEEYEAKLFAAIANGTPPPPPLRDHPAGPMGEEAWLTRIAMEGK